MASVLVVRDYDEFSRILEENGFTVVNAVAIKTVAIVEAIEIGDEIDGVFITSRKAAEIFAGTEAFRGAVYVLGQKSFEILKDRGFDLRFDRSANRAAEMLEAIPRKELEGKRFAFVRGEESLRVIPDGLRAIAATVDEIIVYRTKRVELPDGIAGRDFDWICFFSPSAVSSFVDQKGLESLNRSKIAAIGKTTAAALAGNGIDVEFVSPNASGVEFAKELIKREGN